MQPAKPRREIADEAYFSPGNDCSRKIVDLLGRTRHKLDICVFTITDDRGCGGRLHRNYAWK